MEVQENITGASPAKNTEITEVEFASLSPEVQAEIKAGLKDIKEGKIISGWNWKEFLSK